MNDEPPIDLIVFPLLAIVFIAFIWVAHACR
jgi:hypothetical protein